MRAAKYLSVPIVAFGFWFACGKLSKTRNDKSSAEKTTETGTTSETDTSTATEQLVLETNDDCLSLGKVEDDDARDRYVELRCAEKATFCEADADCTYGGAGGCSGPSPIGKKLEALVVSAHEWSARAADCAQPPKPFNDVTPVCQEHSCRGKVAYQKKDGSAAECVFGKGADCDASYLCESVYFGDEIVDVREYAEDDAKCPVPTTSPQIGKACYLIPAGNTATPQPATYQWLSYEAACRMYDNAAAK